MSDAVTAEKELPEKVYRGGKEGQLAKLGVFWLILSLVGAMVCLIWSGHPSVDRGYADDWGENGVDWMLIGIGFAAIFQGIISFFVFTAAAEIIRLLKRLNGLPYGGKISEATAESGVSSD